MRTSHLIAWLSLPIALLVTPTGSMALEVGEPAPGFSLLGSDGRTHRLEEYAGKQGVVLAWFPKAFTPG